MAYLFGDGLQEPAGYKASHTWGLNGQILDQILSRWCSS